MPNPLPHTTAITAVILAGGEGRRMGGQDKGLVPFRGRPLIAHVIERLHPQVTTLLISANRSAQRYREFGYPVVADTLPDFPGPLAGILAALEQSRSELLLAVPCDTPLLPADLVARLATALAAQRAEIAIPIAGGQLHAAFLLMRREVMDDLRDYLSDGERKVQLWLARHRTVHVDFSDAAAAFTNLNTVEELQALEQPCDH